MVYVPRALVVILLVASLAGPSSAAPQAVQDQAPQAAQPSHTDKARALVGLLTSGDFAAAVATFDATMTAALPEEKLREFWTVVAGQAGAFQQIESAREEPRGAYTAVILRAAFAHIDADLTVVYDTAGAVAGFNIRPATPPPLSSPPYADQSAFTEQDVTVGSGEWALPGTLAMPKGDGPFPAVVLVHGSGPNDRDETIGPNKPFRDLAHGLASRGIAVLRYDKRSKVHGAKMASDPGMTVAEESVDDAAIAVDLLAARADIDAGRIFVLGHSLGAMLVPRIAAAAPGARGFIAMAGPARPIEQAMVEQTEYIVNLDGVVSPEEQARLDAMRELFARVRALTPDEAGTNELIGGAAAAYWLDLRGYDPPEAAKEVTRPMLVLQGERDYQVTMAEFERWRAALDAANHVTLKSYPSLNHLFMPGSGPGSPQEYAVPGHVAEDVVRDIAEWILDIAPIDIR